MADVHDQQTRSYNMSRIRGKDTKPELLVRKALFTRGFRYRLHDKKLSGCPDIVLKKYKTAVFINGCFWHGHEGCRYFKVPKTRTDWWVAKINRNREKDLRNSDSLLREGWKVVSLWECELKSNTIENTLSRLIKQLKDR